MSANQSCCQAFVRAACSYSQLWQRLYEGVTHVLKL